MEIVKPFKVTLSRIGPSRAKPPIAKPSSVRPPRAKLWPAIPKTEVSAGKLPKPVSKGVRNAHFRDDRRDWDGKYHEVIGTSTRKITLDSSFVLTKYVKLPSKL